MAKQVINVGNAAQDGRGDPLRDAMIKINANFTELYDGIVVQTIVGENGTTLVDINTNSVNADTLTGTVPTGVATWDNLGGKPTSVAGFGIADAYTIAQTDAQIASEIDDLKVELGSGGAGAIDASVLTGSLPAIDGSALTGITAGVASSLDGDMTGSVFADDSTLLVDGVSGTIPAANLTGALPAIDGSALTGVVSAFSDLTGTPTTLAGYGITDAMTAGGDIEGNLSGSVFADDSTLLVDGVNGTLNATTLTGALPAIDGSALLNLPAAGATEINDLTDVDTATIAPSRDTQPLVWDTVDSNWYPGNGISISAIARIETGGMLYFDASSSMVFEGTTANTFETTITASDPSQDNAIVIPDASGTLALTSDIPTAYTDSDVDTHLNQSTAGTNEVLSWDGADYAWVAQSGGGSGLQSRSSVTGTTSSLADAAEADLDITGFKSYALLTITTDRAARVRLYVSAATRTADASRAEGVDPTSDAGLIAEVITTGADTVIISPGAYGFNLESTPTTTIPCRVTNKSGSTSTVQVDLNILKLEA